MLTYQDAGRGSETQLRFLYAALPVRSLRKILREKAAQDDRLRRRQES
jgi:hypothetical protein